MSCLSIQRVNAARQEWVGIYLNRYNSSTPTIDGIRRNWTRRHEHSNGTLYLRAEAIATIWRDLPPGDVYHPSTGCWLLVTSLGEVAPVTPGILLICLENLRTLVVFEDKLCLHLADIYRGKVLSQHWLQLLAIIFCRQAKIRLIDKYMYTFENPTTVLEALSMVHNWSCTNLGDRPLRRTV